MSEQGPAFAAQLKALLAHRDDDAAWAVFSDWLSAEGSPRGELMALHHQLEQPGAARDALEFHRRELFLRSREVLLGADALLGDLQLTWRRGFIAHAIVPNSGVHADCARELARHPSGALLDVLETGPEHLAAYFDAPGERPVRELILRAAGVGAAFDAVILAADAPPDPEPGALSVGWLATRAPHLRRLVLNDPLVADVSELAHPTLQALELTSNVNGLVNLLLRCPGVQSVHLGARWRGDDRCVGALLCEAPRHLKQVTCDTVPSVLVEVIGATALTIGTLDLRAADVARDVDRLIALLNRAAGKVRKVRLPSRKALRPAEDRLLSRALEHFVAAARK